jgi:hypothetical protein
MGQLPPAYRDQCYRFFLNSFAEKFGEKMAFFAKTTDCFSKILIITLVFEEIRQIFRRKL